MSRTGTRAEREQWRQTLEAQSSESAFISSEFFDAMPEHGPSHADASSPTVVRAKATGRMTFRYDLDGAGTVFAKAYYDENVGRRAYQWLCDFWNSDFGKASEEQVPEPLGYVTRQKMLLMRAVRGVPVSETVLQNSEDEARRCVRASARWLAKFHFSSVANLEVEPPCESTEVLKTAALLTKVAAACPSRIPLLLDLVHQWKELAPKTNLPSPIVPLHGQFRPEHVFIERETVVVIDLDKLRLSDPAKDVARFLHVMRKTCIESSGDLCQVERLSREFAQAYGDLAPANLGNLRYYMALYSLKELGKVMKSEKADEGRKAAIEELYLTGFQQWAQPSNVVPFLA